MGIIDDLKPVTVLHHEYAKKRCYCDFSDNGNDGTPNLHPYFTGRGVRMTNIGVVTVPYSSELIRDDFSVVLIKQPGVLPSFPLVRGLSFRDGSGTHLECNFAKNVTAVYDGTADRTKNVNPENVCYVGFNLENNTTGEIFYDGVSVGGLSSNLSITPYDTDLKIGNIYTNNRGFPHDIYAAFVFTRQLTSDEHLALYEEMMLRIRANVAPHVRSINPDTGVKVYKTLPGMFATEQNVSSGKIANTPFGVVSGVFNPTTGLVSGSLSKTIRCVSSGQIYMPTSLFKQTPSQAAYGPWCWWIKKKSGTVPRVQFISNIIGITSAGYRIDYADASTSLVESGVAVLLSTDSIGVDTWSMTEMVRADDDTFSLYIDGDFKGSVNDSSVTTSSFFVLDLDTGDEIAYASFDGKIEIRKETLP